MSIRSNLRAICLVSSSISLLLSPLQSVNASVLSGPILSSVNNHTYYLLSSNSWTNSEAEAVSLGGHLTTLRTFTENLWVYNTFTPLIQNYQGSTLWIGFSDAGHVGSFTWASGEPVTYTNWSPGQPDHARGNEDYAHLWTPNIGQPALQGQWNDLENNPAPQFNIHGFGVVEVVKAVPEPEEWVMMLFGFGLVGYQVSRKKKVSARS